MFYNDLFHPFIGIRSSNPQDPIGCPKITSAGCVWLDFEHPTPKRKRIAKLVSHRHIRRFLGVLSHDLDAPSSGFCAQEQRRGKLRALLDAHPAFARSWAITMNERRQLLIGGIDAIAQLAQSREQGRLRAFMHTRYAVQSVDAFP